MRQWDNIKNFGRSRYEVPSRARGIRDNVNSPVRGSFNKVNSLVWIASTILLAGAQWLQAFHLHSSQVLIEEEMLRLEFAEPVRTDMNQTSAVITLSNPAGTEFHKIPVPWIDVSPDVNDPEVILPMNLAGNPVFQSWLSTGRILEVSFSAGVFYSDKTPTIGNFAVSQFPVEIFQNRDDADPSGMDGLFIHWVEYREFENVLALHFSQPVSDSLTNVNGRLRLYTDDSDEAPFPLPWLEVSPVPNDPEIWIHLPETLQSEMSGWPDYPFGLYLEVDSNVFISDLGKPNTYEPGQAVHHPDELFLDIVEYDADNGSLWFTFNHEVDAGATDLQGFARLLSASSFQELTLSTPLQLVAPDPPDNYQLGIQLTDTERSALDNWPDRQRSLLLDLDGGLFQSREGSPNHPVDGFPVWLKGVVLLVYASYQPETNNLHLEFNAALDKSQTDLNAVINLYTYDSTHSLRIATPFRDNSLPEWDQEILLSLDDFQAEALESWPGLEEGLMLDLPAGLVQSTEGNGNLEDRGFWVDPFNDIGTGGGDFRLEEAVFNPDEERISLRFSHPIEDLQTNLQGLIRVGDFNASGSSVELTTPLVVEGEPNDNIVYLRLNSTDAADIDALQSGNTPLSIDINAGTFRTKELTSGNPDIFSFPLNYGYTIVDQGGFPYVHGLRFFYHEALRILRVEGESPFYDDQTDLSGNLALHLGPPANLSLSLSVPWQDVSPNSNDHEILIRLNPETATTLSQVMEPGLALGITADANVFVQESFPAGNPAIVLGDSVPVFWIPEFLDVEKPFQVLAPKGYTREEILPIRLLDPALFEFRVTFSPDTTSIPWQPADSVIHITLPPQEGEIRFALQFKKSTGEITPWYEDSVVLDQTPPVLSWSLDSVAPLSGTSFDVSGTFSDNLSDSGTLQIVFKRERDGLTFNGSGWSGNDTGRNTVGKEWMIHLDPQYLEAGSYSLSLAVNDRADNASPWVTRSITFGDANVPVVLLSLTGLDTADQRWEEDKAATFSVQLRSFPAEQTISFSQNTREWISLKNQEANQDEYRFTFEALPLQKHVGTGRETLTFNHSSGAVYSMSFTYTVNDVNDAPLAIVDSVNHQGGAVKIFLKVEDEDGSLQTTRFHSQLIYNNPSGTDGVIAPRDSTAATLVYYPLPDGNYRFSVVAEDAQSARQTTPTQRDLVVKGITQRQWPGEAWHMVGLLEKQKAPSQVGSEITWAHWNDKADAGNLYSRYIMTEQLNQLEAGRGYWMYSQSDVSLETPPQNLMDTVVTVGLWKGFTGWNQVANPYAYTVKLNQPGVTLFAWNPATADFENTGGVMSAGKAYWAFTDADRPLNLSPKPYFPQDRFLLKQAPLVSGSSWNTRISLAAGNYRDEINYIGWKDQNQTNLTEPPKFGNHLSLFFSDTSRTALTTDFRNKPSQGETWWDVEIRQEGTAQKSGTLVFDQNPVEDGTYLFLVNRELAKQVAPSDSLTVNLTSRSTHFSLVATQDPNFIHILEKGGIQAEWSPNPVRRQTRVKFFLPLQWSPEGKRLEGRYDVSVALYNSLGRVIHSEKLGAYGSGFHSLDWNPSGRSGKRTSPGYYVVQLRAGRLSHSQPLILLP